MKAKLEKFLKDCPRRKSSELQVMARVTYERSFPQWNQICCALAPYVRPVGINAKTIFFTWIRARKDKREDIGRNAVTVLQYDERNTGFLSRHLHPPTHHSSLSSILILTHPLTGSPDSAAAPRILLREDPALLAPHHSSAELGEEVLDHAPQLDRRAGLVVLLRDHAAVLVVYEVHLGDCKWGR